MAYLAKLILRLVYYLMDIYTALSHWHSAPKINSHDLLTSIARIDK